MKILIGTQALKKLRKHFTGIDEGFPHDTDYLVDTPTANNTDGIDLVPIRSKLTDDQNPFLIYMNETGRSLSMSIDGEDAATPYTLICTYLCRLKRSGYMYKKCISDYPKIQELLKWISKDDLKFIQYRLVGNIYPEDGLFSDTNPCLAKVNYIPEEYALSNEYAVMYYYEHYLFEYYDLKSEQVDVIGHPGTNTTINGVKVYGIGEERPYNTFHPNEGFDRLDREYRIEKISSLLKQKLPDDVKRKLRRVQTAYSIE